MGGRPRPKGIEERRYRRVNAKGTMLRCKQPEFHAQMVVVDLDAIFMERGLVSEARSPTRKRTSFDVRITEVVDNVTLCLRDGHIWAVSCKANSVSVPASLRCERSHTNQEPRYPIKLVH